jgi:hypothetical protein
MPVPSKGHYVFTVFRLLTDFVCLYNYEFWVPKRSTSQRIRALGLFPGAVVVRGKDWSHGMEDGNF